MRLRFPLGGTLRVVVLRDALGQSGSGDPILDPQREYVPESFEILRCCLSRTLFQYSGKPTSEGGATIRPDLATALPEVSPDGQTWTIHIRKGIHYGPPLADHEVVAQDFVTALKREAKVTQQDFGADYQQYYNIIEGFGAFAQGKADSISGIQTPDPHTLIVSLTGRVGDIADRFALPATAPIPSLPSSGALGVASGHDAGYGRFMVATGPYMFEGSEVMTPAAPPKDQKPAAGFARGRDTIHLVRNPSWVAATDDLRPAYADRIDIRLMPSVPAMQAALDDDTADTYLFGGPPTDMPIAQLHRYQADPSLGKAFVTLRDSVRYAFMNLAVVPFDDIHVRRAANFIVDKSQYITAFGGPISGQPPTHIVLDSEEDNQLLNYDPFKTTGPDDAFAKAKAEMRLSRYDTDKDGACDASACRAVLALTFGQPAAVNAARTVVRGLAKIGIRLDLHPMDGQSFFNKILDPRNRIPIGIGAAWTKDFINASQYIAPLFGTPQLNNLLSFATQTQGTTFNFDYGLVGATPEQLRKWKYPVTTVPSVDDRITACAPLVGQPSVQCWTNLDQYLTETVVPWIPLILETGFIVVPARVVNFSLDQWVVQPSLDQLVVQQPSPSSS